jgi:hypothetical protein
MSENLPNQSLQEVTLSPTTWHDLETYIGTLDLVTAESLQSDSETSKPGQLNLRKPDGTPLSLLEASAAIEALQSRGKVSLQPDEETGGFIVNHDMEWPRDPGAAENDPTVRRRQAGERLAQFLQPAGKHIGLRVAEEAAHTYRHYGRSLNSATNHATRFITQSGKRAQKESQQAAASQANAIRQWEATQRQTKLRLAYSEHELAVAQAVREQQFDPDIRAEIKYIDSTIEQNIKREIKNRFPDGRGTLPRKDFLALSAEMRDKIVREYLGEDASEDDIEAFKVQLVRSTAGRRI